MAEHHPPTHFLLEFHQESLSLERKLTEILLLITLLNRFLNTLNNTLYKHPTKNIG